jgi:hypothetical protein
MDHNTVIFQKEKGGGIHIKITKWETTERSGETSGRCQLQLIETLFRDPSDVTLPKFSK